MQNKLIGQQNKLISYINGSGGWFVFIGQGFAEKAKAVEVKFTNIKYNVS